MAPATRIHSFFRRLPCYHCYSTKQPRKKQPGAPIRVGFADNAGRGVFATCYIEAGDIIHTAEPVVAHPTLNNLNKVCQFCLKKLEKGETVCCSTSCRDSYKTAASVEQMADWSNLYHYCREHDVKFPLLAKRLACRVASNELVADILDVLCAANLSTDIPHAWMEERGIIKHTLLDSGVQEKRLSFLTNQWYADVMARIHINAFRVEMVDKDYGDLATAAINTITGDNIVGSAVYILPSMYNHDCDPNVNIQWFDDATAKMIALRAIQADEELRITYIDASMAAHVRRKVLEDAYGFVCQCPRCTAGE